MQVRVDKNLLVKEVRRTLGVVERQGTRSTMPILSHVLMHAENDRITISATDLEVSYRGFCQAEVDKPGALALPAHYFHNLVKGLPGTMMVLTITGKSKLQVQTEKTFYKLEGLPSEQFPSIQEVAEDSMVEVEAAILKEMINKIIFSSSSDEYKDYSGIYLELVEKEGDSYLRMVSTDGHRLTLIDRRLPLGNQISLEKGVLVPLKGALEISKALDGEKNTVGLSLTEKEMVLKVNGKFLMVRLLDRKFPEYRRVIPDGFEYGFAVDRESLMAILRRFSMLSTERFKRVVLELGLTALKASVDNPEVGKGRENLPLTMAFGNDVELPLKVGFNVKFLLEPLSVMKSEKVLLEITSPDRPCRIRGEGDPDYFGMAAPLSLV